MGSVKTVFISNYMNHHQKPFSDAMYAALGEEYHFIQTEPMAREREDMGWGLDAARIPYVVFSYREEERCRALLDEADLVLAGWTERTDLFLPRMEAGKLTLRLSERIYREGQWKAVSPRGLLAKYREHVRFRNKPVYLLCIGAYVAADFALIGAYPGKMLKFGYFPPFRAQDVRKLFDGKRAQREIQLVWAARFIPLKHPEYAVRLAAELKAAGALFHLHMIGGGPLEADVEEQIAAADLGAQVTCHGFLKPDQVRDVMEAGHIFLFTSNYLEGWGAVLNEAMNSGCCVVASARTGAAPFLIEDGKNGVTWPDGGYQGFAGKVKELLARPERIEEMGRAAYETIRTEWNAERAAGECLRFYENWKRGVLALPESGPFSRAERLPARWKYDEGKLE